jgi:hypothetical protein
MKLVPDRITTLTAHEVCEAFRDAYLAIEGVYPSDYTLATLVAQSALETGQWHAIHCYNFGNIKASEHYPGEYTMFRCNELIAGKLEWFDPPHPQTWFRAYETAAQGAHDYLAFLAVATHPPKPNRYALAWLAAKSGNPTQFAHELHAAGYYTASERLYIKGEDANFMQFLPLASAVNQTEPPPAQVA